MAGPYLRSKSVAKRQQICQFATISPKIRTSLNSVYCPPAPTPPLLCPSKPPIFRQNFCKFSNVLHISQTYSSAIPPLFICFCKLFTIFHTLKHFSTPPTPIFSPKSRVTSHLSNSPPPFLTQNPTSPRLTYPKTTLHFPISPQPIIPTRAIVTKFPSSAAIRMSLTP